MGCTVSIRHQTFYSNELYNGHRYYATTEKEYFDEGCFTYAFKGKLHGKGPENNKPCVTKVFKDVSSAKMSEMRNYLKTSTLAKNFANEFIRTCLPALRYLELNIQVDFVMPFVATIKRLAGVETCGLCIQETDEHYLKMGQNVFIEPYISGNYEKFNANGGWENEEEPVLTAFCHWTWHRSEGKYMVCNLQGAKIGRNYTLTDPAINSTDAEHKFGNTDLGDHGMVMVLINHTCNRVCHQLGLTNPFTRYRHMFSFEGSKTQSTLYSFQVSKIDLINAQRIIAMRKPIPDPILMVSNTVQNALLPVGAVNLSIHKHISEKRQRNRNVATIVYVVGPISNDWPLPCNFYCNHCLREAVKIKHNRWTFS